jgi:hypothetical protein
LELELSPPRLIISVVSQSIGLYVVLEAHSPTCSQALCVL